MCGLDSGPLQSVIIREAPFSIPKLVSLKLTAL